MPELQPFTLVRLHQVLPSLTRHLGRIFAMSNQNASSLANSDTPIPVVQVHPADGSAPRTPNPEHASHRLSASKLKDKLESLGDNMSRESTSRMGDRMMNL